MRIMSREEFLATKASNVFVIFGSGPSINDIEIEQWQVLLKVYDSIGFNFFFKGGIETSYYLIREQCCSPKKIFPDQTDLIFLAGMRHTQAIKIISAMRHRPENFQWADHLDLIPGAGMVLQDLPVKTSARDFKDDIFSIGLHHGKSTLTNCIHFAVAMGYEEIIFAGVDLNNSGCYWLPKGEVNMMTKAEGRTYRDAHATIGNTLKLIKMLQDESVIKMSVVGSGSALCKILKTWRCV
jgi:hypothetical protein